MFVKIKVQSLKYKAAQLPSVLRNNYTLPALTAGIQNQGLNNFVPKKGATVLKNVISISANGANTGATFYQNKEFTVLQDAYAIEWKDKATILTDNQYLYLVSSISQVIYGNYEWTNKAGWEKVKKEKIKLPVKKGKIDFDFMEFFIAELEAQRMAELESYLTVTGLKDYELTKEEQKVLTDFDEDKFTWNEYQIKEILQWQKQKEIDPLKLEELYDESEVHNPFYGQATLNNGIISYNRLTKKVLNNPLGKPTILIHSNNQNIVYLETPFYLKDGHGATSVLQSDKLNRINQMCIVASIDKVIKNKYSYNQKATKIELKNSVIMLPSKSNKPDYTLMETLISAVQKLVIKDVVLYTDRKIKENSNN